MPGALDRRSKRARQIGGERGEIGRLKHGLYAASLDPREVQQRVDQFEQAQAVAVHELDALALDRRTARAFG